MKHIFFVMNILALMVAVGSNLLAVFAYIKTRLDWVRHFAWVLFSLFLILFSLTSDSYLLVNNIEYYFIQSMNRLVGALGCALCIHYLPQLGYSFFIQEMPKKDGRFFMLLGVLQPIFYIFYELLSRHILFTVIGSMSLFAAFTYLLLTAHRLQKETTADKKRFVKNVSRLMLFFIPFLILDILIERIPGIGSYFPYGLLSVPLFFIGLNSVILHHGFKTFLEYLSKKEPEAVLQLVNVPAIPEEEASCFYEAYHITPREKEVILLLLKGLSYCGISEELHVSLPTTKRHIYNIYQKTGVKNKIELLNKIQDINS